MAKKRGKSKINKPGTADSTPVATVSHDAASAGAGLMIVNPPLKVCRLCEIEDGPFLNIFDPEKIISKKVQLLMPFVVAENDDLPHKICFRCSAKVEELHEFIQRCIKTQQNLRVTMNKRAPKPETRTSDRNKWEERLNQSQVRNDDICEEVIKRAMEHMAEMNPDAISNGENSHAGPSAVNIMPKSSASTLDPPVKHDSATDTQQAEVSKKSKKSIEEPSKTVAGNANDLEIGMESSRSEPDRKLTRSSRSNVAEPLMGGLDDPKPKRKKPTTSSKTVTTDTKLMESASPRVEFKNTQLIGSKKEKPKTVQEASKKQDDNANKQTEPKSGKIISKPPEKTPEQTKVTPKEDNIKPKVFNIMDHVSTIKVNGVGVLFQCKLCNRNFLKKEVVITHGCAKNGAAPTETVAQKAQPPQPPKAPTVKYINTKQDNDVKNTSDKSDLYHKIGESKTKGEMKMIGEEVKPKPRIGPASKVRRPSVSPAAEETMPTPGTVPPIKRRRQSVNPAVGMVIHPRAPSPPKPVAQAPTVQMPIAPSVNCRYKLVPGPNNTFTLVEEKLSQNNASKPKPDYQNNDSMNVKPLTHKTIVPTKPPMRRQSVVDNSVKVPTKPPKRRQSVVDNSVKVPTKPPKRRQSVVDNSVKVPTKPPKRRQSVVDPLVKSYVSPQQRTSARKPSVEYTLSDDEVMYIPEQNNKFPNSQPYPIGLYQSVPGASNERLPPTTPMKLPVFGVPESKRHTYTIVQTDNPNKLLISSKPQIPQPEAPELPPAKRARKSNPASRPTQLMHPAGTSGHDNGNGQFTFINVDPFQQSQYGRQPIVQESQISTSLNQSSQSSNNLEIGQDYACNICPEKFSREKKLHAHIQSHFTKMDQEDNSRSEKTGRRKGKKSV